MPSDQHYYEEACAILGEEKCAEIDAYWSSFFDARWAHLPLFPQDGRSKPQWSKGYRGVGPGNGPSKPTTSPVSPSVLTDWPSPNAGEDGSSRQQPADLAATDHSPKGLSLQPNESRQETSQLDLPPLSKGGYTAKNFQSGRVRRTKDSLAISRTARLRARSAGCFKRRYAASYARRAGSCPPTGRSPLPLTAANLALASNAALLHNLYIPQIVTPSVGNKRKRAYGRDDEKAQKRSRTESPLSRKRTPSGVNKRKRDDGKDQEEEEEISTKRSRSMPHSEDLSLASTDTGSTTSGCEDPRNVLPSWVAELAAKPPKPSKPLGTTYHHLKWFSSSSTDETESSKNETLATPESSESSVTSEPLPSTLPDPEVPAKKVVRGLTLQEEHDKIVQEAKDCPDNPIKDQYAKLSWTKPISYYKEWSGQDHMLIKAKESDKNIGRQSARPVHSSPLRTLLPGYAAIGIHCKALGLHDGVADTAKAYFHEVVKSDAFEELNIRAIAAACIGHACQSNNVPHHWYETTKPLGLDPSQAGRALRQLGDFFFPRGH